MKYDSLNGGNEIIVYVLIKPRLSKSYSSRRYSQEKVTYMYLINTWIVVMVSIHSVLPENLWKPEHYLIWKSNDKNFVNKVLQFLLVHA